MPKHEIATFSGTLLPDFSIANIIETRYLLSADYSLIPKLQGLRSLSWMSSAEDPKLLYRQGTT
jgi:hypothetical protein